MPKSTSAQRPLWRLAAVGLLISTAFALTEPPTATHLQSAADIEAEPDMGEVVSAAARQDSEFTSLAIKAASE